MPLRLVRLVPSCVLNPWRQVPPWEALRFAALLSGVGVGAAAFLAVVVPLVGLWTLAVGLALLPLALWLGERAGSGHVGVTMAMLAYGLLTLLAVGFVPGVPVQATGVLLLLPVAALLALTGALQLLEQLRVWGVRALLRHGATGAGTQLLSRWLGAPAGWWYTQYAQASRTLTGALRQTPIALWSARLPALLTPFMPSTARTVRYGRAECARDLAGAAWTRLEVEAAGGALDPAVCQACLETVRATAGDDTGWQVIEPRLRAGRFPVTTTRHLLALHLTSSCRRTRLAALASAGALGAGAA